MQMKKPVFEVVLFDEEDILTVSCKLDTSGCNGDGSVLCQTGDDCFTDL